MAEGTARPWERLASHSLVATDDVEEFHARTTELFISHHLRILDSAAPGPFRLNSAAVGSVGIGFLSYGTPVRLRAREPFASVASVASVALPLAGSCRMRVRDEELVLHPGLAGLPDPDELIELEVGPDSPYLVLQLDRVALAAQARRLFGPDAAGDLALPQAMSLEGRAARAWRETVDLAVLDLERGDRAQTAHPVFEHQLERLLLSQLLLAHAAVPDCPTPSATPRTIRLAHERIVEHAREALTVEDVAESVGLSVRALQEGFRRHLDTTPSQRIRDTRLEGAHRALRTADPTRATVAAIASDWGFAHLGRFSAAYRRRFGVPPSATLRT